jgi:hypothetical protein
MNAVEMIAECAKHQLPILEVDRWGLLREAGCVSNERMPYRDQQILDISQGDMPPEGSWIPW